MSKLCSLLAILPLVFGLSAVAAPNNPNTDWFQKAGYGVFVHYLNGLQNSPQSLQSLGQKTSWDQCVAEFDVERFADAMAQAQAGYVIFTMHQQSQFFIAPNATFDRLTGYKPGEACAKRDLVADLYQALHRRNIRLMLYWTGDGPRLDPRSAAALKWNGQPNLEFVKNWAKVAEDYGNRYGDKVDGWWVDGSYPWIGYDDEKLGIMAAALKAGNPKRIVAFNRGVDPKVLSYSRHDDYTAGEQTRFLDRPLSRWLHGEQWHIVSFLGAGISPIQHYWGQPGTKYTRQDLINYVAEVNAAGGVVSIDVLLYRDGGLDRSQLEMLKSLRPGLAAWKASAPVPAGNLAYRKPARLLSLDGTHELEVNRDTFFPRLGVDGRPDTVALAGGEWAWTFEVDLLQARPLRRVKVIFPPNGYATAFRITVSTDAKHWQQVAMVEGQQGQPYTCEFAPTMGEFVRISAVKPDGPNQKGSQMAIAELEVYE